MNFYNDNDLKACATLRELIADGLIPDGIVDSRSILEIKADELSGYRQCHFFAGAGFWSLALQWAGLGDADGVWTGSCPCQPFSCAGSGKGVEDDRHLWPVFFNLIRQCRPRVVFGEQVASAAVVGHVGTPAAKPVGPVWLDGVRRDVEAQGYAFGAAVLGAHSVGAPHIRQRLYWVADWTANPGGERAWRHAGATLGAETRSRCAGRADGMRGGNDAGAHGNACGPSDAERLAGESRRVANIPRERDEAAGERAHAEPGRLSTVGGTSLAACGGQRADGGAPGKPGHAELVLEAGGAPDVLGPRLEGHAGNGDDRHEPGRHGAQQAGHATTCVGVGGACDAAGGDEQRDRQSGQGVRRQVAAGGSMPWGEYVVHRYLDGKSRRIPTEPRLFPLADAGHPLSRGRVGILRLAGNAIVPQVAAEFIAAWREIRTSTNV